MEKSRLQFQNLNKKGIFDVIYMVVGLFMLALTIIIIFVILSHLNDTWQSTEELGNESQEIMENYHSSYVNLWDYAFLFMLIGLFIAVIISSFYIDVHPIFFIISIILLIGVLIVTGILSNTFIELVSTDAVSSEASSFTIIPFVMNHFVMIICIMAFIIVGVMYAKNKLGGY